MPKVARPLHNLWSGRKRTSSPERRSPPTHSRARQPFIVRNPRFPPLPSWASAPIPRVIYLTYKEADQIPASVIQNISRLNPDWNIQLFGDLECIAYLEEHWPKDHVEHFRSIPDGPIRADFWRACIMYTHGGCYIDADTVLEVPIDSLIVDGVDVCTAGSVAPELVNDRKRRQWNPAIIIARPRTRVMARAVGRLLACSNVPYSYWRGSITYALAVAASQECGRHLPSNTEGVYTTKKGEQLKLMREVQYDGDAGMRSIVSNGTRVMRNHNPAIYDNRIHRFRDSALN